MNKTNYNNISDTKMAGAGTSGRNLRCRLKTIELGSVQYTECPGSLCAGYGGTEKDDPTSPMFKQAPTLVTIIGRVMHLVQQNDPLTSKWTTKSKATHIAASELRVFWVYGMTSAPVTEINVARKILKAYDEFNKLNKYPKNKRGATWETKVEEYNNRMQTGLDITTTDKDVIKEVKEEFEIQIKDDDKNLVEDNCKVKNCKCSYSSITKRKQCPRQIFISLEVAQLEK